MDHIRKLTWQQLARSLAKAQTDSNMSIRDLSEEYGHSIGKIQCYLTLADALKYYPELETERRLGEAVLFIKKKKFHRSHES